MRWSGSHNSGGVVPTHSFMYFCLLLLMKVLGGRPCAKSGNMVVNITEGQMEKEVAPK